MEEELVTITSTKHGIEGEEVGLLQKMWTTSDCFDVTLVNGDGEQVLAHRAVLAACRFVSKNAIKFSFLLPYISPLQPSSELGSE